MKPLWVSSSPCRQLCFNALFIFFSILSGDKHLVGKGRIDIRLAALGATVFSFFFDIGHVARACGLARSLLLVSLLGVGIPKRVDSWQFAPGQIISYVAALLLVPQAGTLGLTHPGYHVPLPGGNNCLGHGCPV